MNAQLHAIAKGGAAEGSSIFDLDRQFHRLVVEAGSGPRLLALYDTVKPQTERYWRLYASNILGQLDVAVAEHERILRALRDGNADEADAALATNWNNGAERIADVIAQAGERGTW